MTTSIVVAAYDSSLLSERGGGLTDSSLKSVVFYILMLDLKDPVYLGKFFLEHWSRVLGCHFWLYEFCSNGSVSDLYSCSWSFFSLV